MTDSTDDIDYGYDGEEEELDEDDQELIDRYEINKNCFVSVHKDRLFKGDVEEFTLAELMRLSALIADQEKWSKS